VKMRRLEVRLPPGLPNRQYAAVAQAVWAVLRAAGLDDSSSLRPDKLVTDSELNRAFDEGAQHYPWGP